jgi:lincosamide nucleotidyltransferase A/C/D/E
MKDNAPDNPMPAEYVTTLITLFEDSAIWVWVDGGWGVDALLGEQTRPHQDLDLAVALDDVEQMAGLLRGRGYTVHRDELPTRLELRDARGYRIDLHPLTVDEHGNGLQQLQDGTFATYTAEGLSATGRIGAMVVRCLSPRLQMRFHEGYEPDDNDVRDVLALHERFGIPLPEPYQHRT